MNVFKSARAKVLAAVSALVLVGSGAAIGTAAAATTAPPPGNLYGCITATRTIEHAYTTEKNFVAFLNAHGGKCPSGFPFTLASGKVAPPPVGAPKYELTSLDRATTPAMPDPNVKGGPNDGGPVVRQEVWNLKPALKKQDTKVWGPGNWQSTINAAAGNVEVNSYPDVSDTVTTAADTPRPVASYSSLVSTYAENMHATAATDAEAAYDVWLNNYNNELMIWVDNHGQTPAGTDTGQDITVGSNTFRLWNSNNGEIVSLVLDHNAQTGSIDILGVIHALQAKNIGGYGSSAGINQIEFGFETPSTGGVDETFAVTGYTLKYS